MSVPSSPIDTASDAESQGLQKNGSAISSEDGASISNESADSEADRDPPGYEQRRATDAAKKRKSETWAGNGRKKRYNDHYRQLLNDTINTAVAGSSYDEYQRALPSQHGVSWWTADEKAIMFNVLSRKGESDVRSIAAAISTKSEMEIWVYLKSIRKALETKLRQPRADRLSLIDIPAAAEVGEECCYVLDQHAQTLSSLQQVFEEKAEHEKHAEFWLLTYDIAKWVEAHMADESPEGGDIRERLPAVSLLNLPKWLELSERIFMNPASPREAENWRTMVEGHDTPSIMNTAFSDFHALAVGVTKRLVQSSLFYAMSRLRATDSSRYRYRPVVRAKDVRVAVQVLGMKATAYDFWMGAPRRCNLHIYQDRAKKRGQVGILDYDQVERLLSREETDQQHKDRQTDSLQNNLPEHDSDGSLAPAIAKAPTTEESGHETSCRSSDFTGSDDSSGIEGESQVETDQERPRKQRRARRRLERDEDEYVEMFDQQVSQAEEERIWNMLGESPTSGLKAENVDLPKRPDIRGKLEPNLVRWRDKIEFWSDWEHLDTSFPRVNAGRKMERVGLHDRLETNEDEALVGSRRHVKERREDADDGERIEVESAEIDPEKIFTTNYTSIGSVSDDVESSCDASEDRSCKGNRVEYNLVLPADLNREDPSLSPGSDYEEQSSMELDVDPESHVYEKSNEENKSEGDDSPTSTLGSEVPSTSTSAHSS